MAKLNNENALRTYVEIRTKKEATVQGMYFRRFEEGGVSIYIDTKEFGTVSNSFDMVRYDNNKVVARMDYKKAVTGLANATEKTVENLQLVGWRSKNLKAIVDRLADENLLDAAFEALEKAPTDMAAKEIESFEDAVEEAEELLKIYRVGLNKEFKIDLYSFVQDNKSSDEDPNGISYFVAFYQWGTPKQDKEIITTRFAESETGYYGCKTAVQTMLKKALKGGVR